MIVVVDTNLVVPAFLTGEQADLVDAVRARAGEWVAPPLWASEFRNVAATYVRTQGLHRADAHAAWQAARRRIRDVAPDPERVLDIAIDLGLTGYDAEFVAVADALGAHLVTDDRRLRRAYAGAVSIAEFAAG